LSTKEHTKAQCWEIANKANANLKKLEGNYKGRSEKKPITRGKGQLQEVEGNYKGRSAKKQLQQVKAKLGQVPADFLAAVEECVKTGKN
jgi:hypothetical protein